MLSLHKNPILCILAPLYISFLQPLQLLCFILLLSSKVHLSLLHLFFNFFYIICFLLSTSFFFFFISFFFFFSFSLTIVMIFFPEIIDARMHERCIRSTIPKKRNQQHNAVITFKLLERQGDKKKNIFITLVYPRWSTFFFHFNSLLPEVLLHEQIIWICI